VVGIVMPVVILAGGLVAGVMMWTQLGGWPLMSSLPPGDYVYTHAFFSTRFDPFMPACMMLAMVGDLVLVGMLGGVLPAAICAVAALLSATCIVISLWKNVPVNRWMRTLDPACPPAELATVRRRWGEWNRVRAILAVVSFGLNCTVLADLL
jgi:hypothetical protein